MGIILLFPSRHTRCKNAKAGSSLRKNTCEKNRASKPVGIADAPGSISCLPPGRFTAESQIESLLITMNQAHSTEVRFDELERLVVFSPEITCGGSACGDTQQVPATQWGDVFLNIGDTYPFIFTLYTKKYVHTYFLSRGEKIAASPRDVIMDKQDLTPRDIVQATIKWVNRYYPALKGLPIDLEREEIIQELVSDPGRELLIPDSTELLFL